MPQPRHRCGVLWSQPRAPCARPYAWRLDTPRAGRPPRWDAPTWPPTPAYRLPGWGVPPSPPTHGSPPLACARPNAGRQAPPEAAATQERRLEAVACTPWLGGNAHHVTTDTMVVLPDARFTTPRSSPTLAYWITLSAWKRSVGGMVRPSALAVLRLITSSNLIGRSTGRSAGFAPFRILSTYVAVRRKRSSRCAP